MGKYIKKFETHSEYNTYITGQDKILPNVSYCVNENELHYNPYSDPRLIVEYTVVDDSNPTQLYFYYNSGNEGDPVVTAEVMFEKVEIDNVEVSISDLDTAQGAYQLSEGEHTVKYTLNEPTLIGFDASTMTVGAVFMQCTSITSVTIPNSVTSIGESPFGGCSGLTSITIGSGVTTIGERAFQSCSSLTSVTIPNGVTSIGDNAFYGCTSLTSVVIPNSVTTIGNYAFYGCSGLTSVTIGNSVTTIGYSAFYQCTSLTSVTIGNSVTTIGNDAFYECSGLTSITIPNSVTTIGSYAFSGCTGLTSVTVQATTPPTLGTSVFNGNASGRNIYVPSASVDTYKAASGWSDYASVIEAIPSA